MVQYSELSTPLTVEDYTSHLAAPSTASRNTGEILSSALSAPPRSPDSTSVVATHEPRRGRLADGWCRGGERALGQGGFPRIMASVHTAKSAAATPTPARSPYKKRAVLVGKTALTPSIWRLEFELDEAISCTPGQYVMLRVAPLSAVLFDRLG